MKVLLVNPTRTGSDNYVTPPLHMMYIAQSIIKAGHKANIIDLHYQYIKGNYSSHKHFKEYLKSLMSIVSTRIVKVAVKLILPSKMLRYLIKLESLQSRR